MTDAEAKRILTESIDRRRFAGAHLTQESVDVLRHAMQAIEDRAALVADAMLSEDGVMAFDVAFRDVLAARRHMEGR